MSEWDRLRKEAAKAAAKKVSEMLVSPEQLANVDSIKFGIMKQKTALEVTHLQSTFVHYNTRQGYWIIHLPHSHELPNAAHPHHTRTTHPLYNIPGTN